MDFALAGEVRKGGACPFCPGNEDKTPPEVLAYRPGGGPADTPGWRVRVVPNKFPALRIEGELGERPGGLHPHMNGIGAHEVIVESPDHDASPGKQPPEQLAEALRAIRDRYQDLRGDRRFKYIQVFKNSGSTAGASLEHPHWQLIATPMVPAEVEEELRGARRYFEVTGDCVYCDLAGEESSLHERVLEETEKFVAFCPYASRFPYETWVVPKHHRADFGSISEEEIVGLAQLLQRVIRRLEVAFGDPPYNVLLHTSPLEGGAEKYYHWHLEILPRLTITAGFEWGTGYFINPTAPELAALSLNEVDVPHIH